MSKIRSFSVAMIAAMISLICSFGGNVANAATTQHTQHFDRAIFVIFENTNYSAAMKQPFFSRLAANGAQFTNFLAQTHPSQANYIALTSGSLNGVPDDRTMNINSTNIVDLLEAKGLTWKAYVQGYPGNCFAGKSSGSYVRKHNPFISYDDIRTNPSRCANIVDASEFDGDVKTGKLPNYAFYVPDLNNDGHDTGVAFANDWYEQQFSSLLNDSVFMKNTIVISTFDESGSSSKNQVYTSIVGGPVKVGTYSTAVSHYSLLQMVEENWSLGDLGREDATATPIPEIWR